MFTLSLVHHPERVPELDGAVHSKRVPFSAPTPSAMNHYKLVDNEKSLDDTMRIVLNCTEPMSRDDAYSLWKFEQRYRAFVASTDVQGARALIDDLYHDNVIHMMDGIPMNKTALQHLYVEMLKQGTTSSVIKFQVIDSNHIEVILHTKNGCMNFYGRSVITLKDDKIIRVEKIESAEPAMPIHAIEKKWDRAQAA